MPYEDDEKNEEDEFDLTGVLKGRMLDLSFDYVLIVEWLFERDERTGSALRDWLQGKVPAGKVEYAQCRSRAELEVRLDRARNEVSVRGVPIVHIEAHGEKPHAGQAPAGFVGPDGNGGSEFLGWERLGDVLRPLNIAARFNLLVVGAACYGEGLMLGVRGGEPMPFVAVVGYTDTVSSLSLRHSLVELYRALLLNKAELGAAVDDADRQRHFPEDALLRPTSMTVLLAESFVQGIAISIRKLRRQLSAKAGHVDGSQDLDPTLPLEARQMLRAELEHAWSMMWIQKEIPENARRFAIDADRLFEMAIEYADAL
ncbi:hypothetical protein [Rhodanobacter terrae]|uniref:Uncharacterized protein n=1 Tax=Rhodanobacter terrae TaxID=418647 RepID=A0ABW0SXJ2_9GAMM